MTDPLMRWQMIAEMSDEDLLWELECRGYPEELLKPLRDFVRQPVPDRVRLALWERSAA